MRRNNPANSDSIFAVAGIVITALNRTVRFAGIDEPSARNAASCRRQPATVSSPFTRSTTRVKKRFNDGIFIIWRYQMAIWLGARRPLDLGRERFGTDVLLTANDRCQHVVENLVSEQVRL